MGRPGESGSAVIAEDRARRLGIDRPMIATALQSNFSGTTTGVYREGIELIPIIARAPADERSTMENMGDVLITSPMSGKKIPLKQVVNGFSTEYENARISRWHRRSMIKLHADARTGLPSEFFARVKPRIEQAWVLISRHTWVKMCRRRSIPPPPFPSFMTI